MFPSEDETALWVVLNRGQRYIHRSMDLALKAQGLPPLRWYDVLWSVERAKDDGIRPFELEKMLIFEQSNLSRLLHRMKKEELIEEAVFQDDRRGRILKLTLKGRQLRRQMWQIYGPLIHHYMSVVSERYDPTNMASALRSLFDE